MISASIVDQGTINTTLPSEDDPAFQSASLCLFLRQQFAALRTAGFEFQKAEVSDLSTYSTNLTGWLEDAQERETEIITTGVSEIVANLPDILTIGAAYMSGGASAVAGVIFNIMLERLMGGSQSALAANKAGDIDMAAVVDELSNMNDGLDNIQTAVLQTLNDININVFRDADTQTYSAGPLPEE